MPRASNTIRPTGAMPVGLVMRGRCRSMDPELFFSDDKTVQEQAKEVCWRCPERVECLSWAIEGNISGVFGATTKPQRDKLSWRRDRVHCPVCTSNMVVADGKGQICVACAHTWRT